MPTAIQQVKDSLQKAHDELTRLKDNLEGEQKVRDEAGEIKAELETIVTKHLSTDELDDPFALKLALKDMEKRLIGGLVSLKPHLEEAIEQL